MRKLIVTLTAVFVFILSGTAQDRTISGVVTNDKGKPWKRYPLLLLMVSREPRPTRTVNSPSKYLLLLRISLSH